MAINREPILKRCRYLGISPAVMGISKESNRNPNANKRKKVSEYGMQLKEKQKLKFIYGVLEKPFYHYFEIAEKMEGKAHVLFRMGMALTRRESRQLVSHGHFMVNGQKVDIPSYRVKVGDVIELCEKSKKSDKFKDVAEATKGRVVPLWLEANRDAATAKIVRMPVKDDLDYEVEETFIVELYSK